ncbi:hypothetical protein GF366_03500, partial [Candidatus Peregrinibacteria bacterium]|nr:hypothetical protein [Candidatus Peregrinibacteria bacterium]
GTFKPDKEINRAELTKIVVEIMVGNPGPTYNNCFPDVKNEWFAPYVCYAEVSGWIDGYPDGTFKPANNTNRVEAIKIILNAFFGGKENIPEIQPVSDMPSDADPEEWYYPFLQFAISKDLLDLQHITYYVVSSYNYHGDENMTRKEVAEMLYRLMHTFTPAEI